MEGVVAYDVEIQLSDIFAVQDDSGGNRYWNTASVLWNNANFDWNLA